MVDMAGVNFFWVMRALPCQQIELDCQITKNYFPRITANILQSERITVSLVAQKTFLFRNKTIEVDKFAQTLKI